MTRAGIVTAVGRPNAGKSTFLNAVVGEKLSITSPKPQSTRQRVVGIHSTGDAQLVILDTPGLLNPEYALQKTMRAAALRALADADVIAYLIDATTDDTASLEEAASLTAPPRASVLTLLNKADRLNRAQRALLSLRWPNAHFISALRGEGIAAAVAEIVSRLPESPFLYGAEDISTQSLRFHASELVRETALEQLGDEIPYSIACVIEEYHEDRDPVYIRAVVYVERESQKRIVIGAGGTRIRAIGKSAREKIEHLIGSRVYLDLWLKVQANWRKDEAALSRFGYRMTEDRTL